MGRAIEDKYFKSWSLQWPEVEDESQRRMKDEYFKADQDTGSKSQGEGEMQLA